MLAIHDLVANRNPTLFGPYNEINGKKDFFGVFQYYLMAPALWAGNYDPIGPIIFTAFLGVITVALVFLVVKEWTTTQRALIITWFYAISPLVVKYVTWSWNPNTTPFFSLLFFLALTKLFKQHKNTLLWSGIAGLCLGLLFQLHFFTLPLITAFLFSIYWLKENKKQKNHLNWQSLLIFLGLAILPNLSFVVFDLTHEFFYLQIIKDMFFSSSGDSYIQFSIWNIIWQPVTYSFDLLKKLFNIHGILAGGVLMYLSYRLVAVYKDFKKTRKLSLGFWIGLSYVSFLVITVFFPNLINDYHSAFIWFGLIYLLIEKLPLKPLTYVGLGLLSNLMIAGNHLNQPPDWSQNLPLVRELSQTVVKDVKENATIGDNFNLATFTDADTRGIRYRYFLVKDGVIPSGIDQYAQDKIIYIISPHSEEETKKNPAWEIQTVIDVPWDEVGEVEGVRVYKAEL